MPQASKFEMSKYRYIVILLLVCAAMPMTAQQVYPDTFKLSEQHSTADIDLLLLNMVSAQSAQIHANDTTDTLTLIERMRLDSIQREMAEVDSLRTVNAQLAVKTVEEFPSVLIEKSLIKDIEEDRADVLRALREMKTPWRREATLMAQITQTYVTDNWYQGGSSAFAGLGIAKGQISYISERFTWENTGEWRVGGTTVKGDSLHKVNTTDDLFRLNTKANLRIVPKLFGSFSAEFETRFFPTYKSNSRKLKSGPFSPLRFTLAVGLDYKPVKNLSVSVYPLSYRLTHVHDTARVTVTDYGLKKGERTRHNAGSLIRVEYLWKPVREVALETRFYMFTNYKGVEIDLEVNCDFIINKYLSARVMLHPRYDTDVIMKGDTHAKIQFRELISLGFAHKFH